MSHFPSLTRLALAAGLCLGLAAATASAGTFNFSYTDSGGGVITGQVTGILQADLNTVLVSSVLSSAFNGTPGPALTILVSATTISGGAAVPPTLTLDGSGNDFCAATKAPCSEEGFAFLPAGVIVPVDTFAASPFYGAGFEAFDPTKWSMAAASVPEPASLLLMGTAVAALAALSRRRR